MLVDRRLIFGFWSWFWLDNTGQNRLNYFVPQDQESHYGPQSFWHRFILSGVFDLANEVFAAKFLKVIRGFSRRIISMTNWVARPYGVSKLGGSKSLGFRRKADYRFHDQSDARLIDIDTANSCLANLRGLGQFIKPAIINRREVDANDRFQESVEDFFEVRDDLSEITERPPATQSFGVMNDSFGAEKAFAFSIELYSECIKVNLEHRQVIRRSLDNQLQKPIFNADGSASNKITESYGFIGHWDLVFEFYL